MWLLVHVRSADWLCRHDTTTSSRYFYIISQRAHCLRHENIHGFFLLSWWLWSSCARSQSRSDELQYYHASLQCFYLSQTRYSTVVALQCLYTRHLFLWAFYCITSLELRIRNARSSLTGVAVVACVNSELFSLLRIAHLQPRFVSLFSIFTLSRWSLGTDLSACSLLVGLLLPVTLEQTSAEFSMTAANHTEETFGYLRLSKF